jgi:hypothetical protein
MNQVEAVAFWCGFIASIVGIVLAIVAIAFSILVDRRSSQVSEHTVQSLQKIESVVERLSSDTRELIKAGWDKMLGGVDKSPAPEYSDSNAKQIAAGIAAELRSELVALSADKKSQDGESHQKIEALESYLKDLEASLMGQLRRVTENTRPSVRFEEVTNTIRSLSGRALAFLRAISRAHLTQAEYRILSSGPMRDSILELRKSGLLAPVVHNTGRGEVPCYYYPSDIAMIVRAVLDTIPEPPLALQQEVVEQLDSVGYASRRGRSSNLQPADRVKQIADGRIEEDPHRD